MDDGWISACGNATCLGAVKHPDTVQVAVIGHESESAWPTHDEWRQFVAAVKAGGFDRLLDLAPSGDQYEQDGHQYKADDAELDMDQPHAAQTTGQSELIDVGRWLIGGQCAVRWAPNVDSVAVSAANPPPCPCR